MTSEQKMLINKLYKAWHVKQYCKNCGTIMLQEKNTHNGWQFNYVCADDVSCGLTMRIHIMDGGIKRVYEFNE